MSQTTDKVLSRLAALIGLIPIYMKRLHAALPQFLHRTWRWPVFMHLSAVHRSTISSSLHPTLFFKSNTCVPHNTRTETQVPNCETRKESSNLSTTKRDIHCDMCAGMHGHMNGLVRHQIHVSTEYTCALGYIQRTRMRRDVDASSMHCGPFKAATNPATSCELPLRHDCDEL